jgi:hypothetical protein
MSIRICLLEILVTLGDRLVWANDLTKGAIRRNFPGLCDRFDISPIAACNLVGNAKVRDEALYLLEIGAG